MTNKTIALSRELGSDPITHMAGLLELVVNPRSYPIDILHAQVRSTLELVRAALADPVPPADEDVEVLGYSVKGNRYAIRLTKGELLELYEGYTGDALVELVDRAHVTRLQAEVERYRILAYIGEHEFDDLTWKARCAELRAEVERLKDQLADAKATANLAATNLKEFKEDHRSELAKARELLREWLTSNFTGSCPERNDLRCRTDYALANQSAPADKGPPELTVWYGPMPETNGKSNFTAMLMRKGGTFLDGMTDGICIARGEYPDRIRYEADCMRYLIGELAEEPDITAYDADKHSGYVKPDQPAPVAVVMPERLAIQSHWPEWKISGSEGWNACLDEVARLNSEPKP